MEAPIKRAVIYLRQSHDPRHEGDAVERQREDALRLCELRGWLVHLVLVDNDTSASGKKKRPGYEAALAAVEAGEADVIVAWDMTRLTRAGRDRLRLLEVGKRHNVTLAFVRGSDLDLATPAGRLTADVLGSVAQHEIEQKSDRQLRANEQRAKDGKPPGGRRAFGYSPNGTTLVPDEAQALQEAYTAFLEGVPLGEIAREWNRLGFKAQSRQWERDAVRIVLLNPRNAGLSFYKGEPMGAGNWPTVVSEETWRAVQEMLKDSSRRTAPKTAKNLLTGLAMCGVCGATLHAGGTRSSAYRMYRCSGSTGHVGRKAEPVEAYVLLCLVARLSAPDAPDLLMRDTGPDMEGLREETRVLQTRLLSLATDFADGDLTPAQLRAASERIQKRLREIEAVQVSAVKADLLNPLIRSVDTLRAVNDLDMARKRVVLDQVMGVTVHPPGRGVRAFRPETVKVRWKIGDPDVEPEKYIHQMGEHLGWNDSDEDWYGLDGEGPARVA